jgi:hypothetical protein
MCYIPVDIKDLRTGDFLYKQYVKLVSSDEIRNHPYLLWCCYPFDVNAGNFSDIHSVREWGKMGRRIVRYDFPPLCVIRRGRLRDHLVCFFPNFVNLHLLVAVSGYGVCPLESVPIRGVRRCWPFRTCFRPHIFLYASSRLRNILVLPDCVP